MRVWGFPIRTSTDLRSVGNSPWLFAASHVLLRLQAPRHPPLALYNLENYKKMLVLAMEFSRINQGCKRSLPPSVRAITPSALTALAGLGVLAAPTTPVRRETGTCKRLRAYATQHHYAECQSLKTEQ